MNIWADTAGAFNAITDAIVAYENGPEFARFNSKYDYYLQGRVTLSPIEKLGLELFEAEDKGNCAACHPSQQASKVIMASCLYSQITVTTTWGSLPTLAWHFTK